MQSLVGLLTGAGTADTTKQGPLAQLAPTDLPANADGLAFSDLFLAMLPAEDPVQRAVQEPSPELVENDPASPVDAVDDPAAQAVEEETLDAKQGITLDQDDPKQILAPSSQPTEVTEKLPASQTGVEEWAAVHQDKFPKDPTPARPLLPETVFEPDRPNVTSVGGNIGTVAKNEIRPELPAQPNVQRPMTQADAPLTPVQVPAHVPTRAQSQSSVAENAAPTAQPIPLNKGQPTVVPEGTQASQVIPAKAPATPIQQLSKEVPELAKTGRPILMQNQAQPPAPKAQQYAPDLSAAPAVQPPNKAPVRTRVTFANSAAQPPIVNREAFPVHTDNTQPQIRQPLPDARNANPQKPIAVGATAAQAAVFSATNIAPTLPTNPEHLAKPTQTGTQPPPSTDPSNKIELRHSHFAQAPDASPRKPMPRSYLPHFQTLPLPPETAPKIPEIEPRHVAQLQPQAQMQANPQTISHIGATTAAAPMAKLQIDQRTEARNNLSSGGDFAVSFRTELAATPTVMTPVMARPELASHVAQQIADAVQSLPNRPVEITLNPEELGRLKLHLVTADGGLAVHVTAERPETMDLLRRHIGILDQEFLKLGFEDVAFSFAGGQTSQDQADASKDQAPDQQTGNSDLPPPTNTAQAPVPLQRGGGLDLRV